MKKLKLNSKLTLKKEKIADLNDIRGGKPKTQVGEITGNPCVFGEICIPRLSEICPT
jgi:hypothetical protein